LLLLSVACPTMANSPHPGLLAASLYHLQHTDTRAPCLSSLSPSFEVMSSESCLQFTSPFSPKLCLPCRVPTPVTHKAPQELTSQNSLFPKQSTFHCSSKILPCLEAFQRLSTQLEVTSKCLSWALKSWWPGFFFQLPTPSFLLTRLQL
jgi:hypothetical protein